jgi:hypothetical protein
MLPNAFIGWTAQPTDREVATALGPACELWDDLIAGVTAACGVDGREWKSSGKKYGWSLRLLVKKRRIIYLSPRAGSFGVAFILGAKAVDAARGGALPSKIAKLVENGDRYPEGTGVRIEVSSARDIPGIVKLASIKAAY